MREIEIKAKLKDKQSIVDALLAKGISLTQPIKQHDVVYGIQDAEDNAPGSIWLRIRTENDSKNIFTLKKQHHGGLDSIEHETEITNEHELEKIITLLGYTLYSDLTKTRQKAKIGDVEICLDEVEGLGVFIEAEKLATDDADNAVVVTELWNVLEELGVDRADEVFDGYDVLMNRLSSSGLAH